MCLSIYDTLHYVNYILHNDFYILHVSNAGQKKSPPKREGLRSLLRQPRERRDRQRDQSNDDKYPQHALPEHLDRLHEYVIHFSAPLLKEPQNHAAGHRRDLPGHVRAHGVHEQMVLVVGLDAQLFDHARRHRKR